MSTLTASGRYTLNGTAFLNHWIASGSSAEIGRMQAEKIKIDCDVLPTSLPLPGYPQHSQTMCSCVRRSRSVVKQPFGQCGPAGHVPKTAGEHARVRKSLVLHSLCGS
jgi:hypothetical protein